MFGSEPRNAAPLGEANQTWAVTMYRPGDAGSVPDSTTIPSTAITVAPLSMAATNTPALVYTVNTTFAFTGPAPALCTFARSVWVGPALEITKWGGMGHSLRPTSSAARVPGGGRGGDWTV